MMQKVLVTGSAGFIGGYVVEELLGRGYDVVGIDNFSKYGQVAKSYDDHPDYPLVEGDCRDVELMTELLADCDHFIAGAAMIGGISYFHTYAYDLLATNERIIAAVLRRRDRGAPARAGCRRSPTCPPRWCSSRRRQWPSYEGQEREVPPPLSSYGFQKLAVEYFARAAWDQYELPYTIVRPFNCVGIGESRALGDVEMLSGNVKLAMSHVVPDLVQKVLKGQDPLHILGDGEQVRHYTYGGDLARGIVTAMEHPDARNEDFNLSTAAVHHRARAGRGHLAEDQGPGRAAARTSPTTRSSTTCSAACRPPRRPAGARLRGRPPRSTRCSTRSSRGSPAPSTTAPSKREHGQKPRTARTARFRSRLVRPPKAHRARTASAGHSDRWHQGNVA